MSTILLHVLAAACYAALAGLVWKSQSRLALAPMGGLGDPDPGANEAPAWLRATVLVPLALHAATIAADLFDAHAMRFGFGQALSVMLWLAVAIYWIESWFIRLDGLQAIVLPIAAITVLLPAIFPGFELREFTHSIGFRVHLVMAMAAYSLFTIAALQAVFMAVFERRLHAGVVSGPFARMPPLLTLERTLFRLIAIGFVLLTATIVSGGFFAEQVFGRALRFDHKTLFAVVSWLIFAALLVGRYRYGWRGRTALRWVFAGFIMLLLAYVGSRFVLEVILQRGAG